MGGGDGTAKTVLAGIKPAISGLLTGTLDQVVMQVLKETLDIHVGV